MPTPKRRHTKSKRDRRRSHHALKPKLFSSCPKCGEPIMPHRICFNCGNYAGREVIDVMAKLDKKEKKKKVKELAEQQKEQGGEKGLSMAELSKK
jgi:large subunit ribosomal protein L32